MASMEQIKSLRERTGTGIADIKKALEEANGDEEKAIRILREHGAAKAVKKTDREAKEGFIGSYIHTNGKVGSLVTLYCETDFVARNEDFKALARDIAMHVAAMDPSVVRPEDVPAETVSKERETWTEEIRREEKAEAITEKILIGKEKKFREERALLTQSFVKDPELTIGSLIAENVQKMGENIQIGSFVRFEI